MPRSTPRRVAAVLFPEFELLDVFGPLEVFGAAGEQFTLELVGPGVGPVRSAQGPHVLAGWSDPAEPSGYDFHYDGEAFFEAEIWPRLAHRASSFERCRHVRGWAGLYAVTPDRSGIAGRVTGFANFYEAHSFTGRGVMQSWAVGQAIAELIAEGRYGALDLSALARERFANPEQWVTEELHI